MVAQLGPLRRTGRTSSSPAGRSPTRPSCRGRSCGSRWWPTSCGRPTTVHDDRASDLRTAVNFSWLLAPFITFWVILLDPAISTGATCGQPTCRWRWRSSSAAWCSTCSPNPTSGNSGASSPPCLAWRRRVQLDRRLLRLVPDAAEGPDQLPAARLGCARRPQLRRRTQAATAARDRLDSVDGDPALPGHDDEHAVDRRRARRPSSAASLSPCAPTSR